MYYNNNHELFSVHIVAIFVCEYYSVMFFPVNGASKKTNSSNIEMFGEDK
jgi:hypothetical protein